MAQQQAGFHRVSFTLWYEHVAGINPELNQALAPRADGQQPLNDTKRTTCTRATSSRATWSPSHR